MAEAIATLRKQFRLKTGDTIYTLCKHVSASGMYRVLDLYVIRGNVPLRITRSAAEATGFGYDKKHEGLRASGFGMDVGFHAVYELSRALWPNGHRCAGEKRCRSNDHSSGDRSYDRKHEHADVGYALRQCWL